MVGVLAVLWAGLGPAAASAQSSASAPPAVSAEQLQVVDSLREAGDYRQALAQLQSLNREHPESGAVLYRLALTRVDIGEQRDEESAQQAAYKEALADAKAAIAADSTLADAHLARAIAEGRVALAAGTKEKIRRSRAVKRHADTAIALDSTLAAAYHVRARWNREVSDLGFFERAVVKTVYGGLPEASFEQSVKDFQTAIRLEDVIVHHLELARTYEKMGEDAKAREELQTVLAMEASDPDDPMHKKKARELLEDWK
jgi:FimV-like protein